MLLSQYMYYCSPRRGVGRSDCRSGRRHEGSLPRRRVTTSWVHDQILYRNPIEWRRRVAGSTGALYRCRRASSPNVSTRTWSCMASSALISGAYTLGKSCRSTNRVGVTLRLAAADDKGANRQPVDPAFLGTSFARVRERWPWRKATYSDQSTGRREPREEEHRVDEGGGTRWLAGQRR